MGEQTGNSAIKMGALKQFCNSAKDILISTLFFIAISITFCPAQAQNQDAFLYPSDTLNKQRKNTVYITAGVGFGLSLVALNELWYADYHRSSFHFHNDNDAWLQMDKVGHMYSTYFIGKMGMDALAWAGESKKNQMLYGATMGFAFLTAVEILDGFSEEWGFSGGDMVANGLGTGLLVGQELLWGEQRIQMKFSYSDTDYPEIYPDKLGSNSLEQVFKDYNGQTYWFSVNLWSFFKDSKIPSWLNVSLGYGAEGMPEYEEGSGAEMYSTYRQFYASLDLDLTKIRTNSAFLKTTFNLLNYIKFPSPTLEFTGKGDFKFHAIYF